MWFYFITEWDLLDLLSINGSQPGVSPAKGPIPDTPAWRLRALYDNIMLDQDQVHKVSSYINLYSSKHKFAEVTTMVVYQCIFIFSN